MALSCEQTEGQTEGQDIYKHHARGLLETATSHDHATVGSGSVVNEAAFSYDGFNQMTTDAQRHSRAVGGGTPAVGYAFADGSGGNTARRTSLTYPDGRVVAFGYGSAGSLDDVLSRSNNQANQLTQIDADSSGIAYDGAGTMTSQRPGGADGDDWDENRTLT
ncbi:MAG: hypothetical protein WBE58_23825 [Verrucomicrobiales bacterium]